MEKGTPGSEKYWQRPERLKTWSGYELKAVYGSEDVDMDYATELGKPGEYPYTRGIYPDMHRGRLWTLREVSGHSSPEESNKRLKYLLSQGETGLNVIPDTPTQALLDSDHPLVAGHVGLQGCPLCSLRDMEILFEGIPQDQVSITFSTHHMPMAQYIALADDRGIELSKLRGTCLNDTLHGTICFGTGPLPEEEIRGALRIAVDAMEFSVRYMPRWYPLCLDSYDLRETGINAAQEIGFAFSFAFANIEEALRRGLDIDEVARRISFTVSAHIDLFEEVAKLRAARRVWARRLKERYGAQSPRALTWKIHVNTAGCSMVRQQPLNNVVRIAYEALAAVLGGTQSLHCVAYDEPICLPTEKSHRIAVRTQQILAYEIGVANVADPLGGSYYVEYLTNKLEEEIWEVIKKIDDMGGAIEALASGWMHNEIDKAAYGYQREVETGERILVGKNAFTIPEEEDTLEDEEPPHRVVPEAVEKHLANLKGLRRTRDQRRHREALAELKRAVEAKDVNLFPPLIEATKAYATVEEIHDILGRRDGQPRLVR